MPIAAFSRATYPQDPTKYYIHTLRQTRDVCVRNAKRLSSFPSHLAISAQDSLPRIRFAQWAQIFSAKITCTLFDVNLQKS